MNMGMATPTHWCVCVCVCVCICAVVRAVARNLTQMSDHDVKLTGVCIPRAQNFDSGSWSKHGGYALGFPG